MSTPARSPATWRRIASSTAPNGAHLFTDNAAERASILASRPDLKADGIAF